VLSNQPQGGFITRKPTVDVIASEEVPGNDGFGSIFGRSWGSPSGNSRWDSQTGFWRNGDSQTGFQRKRGAQPGSSSWGGEQYYRREQQGW
jgi:hypothetical protein